MNLTGHAIDLRPKNFEERFRLYIDESGDHVFGNVAHPQHRFLCLVGCWFKNPAYLVFQREMEDLKRRHFPYHPDEPIILHREDIINRRKAFRHLLNDNVRQGFDNDLIELMKNGDYRIVGVVIDKLALKSAYGTSAAHPYHLSMGFLLQRYVGLLNHINRVGDVLAETRGKKEDRLLQESYTRTYERGAWMIRADSFQAALTSKQLKLKPKSANIAGLQLADLLAQPIKHFILRAYNLTETEPSPFTRRLFDVLESKLNRHLYDGRAEGYGYVLYPQSK